MSEMDTTAIATTHSALADTRLPTGLAVATTLIVAIAGLLSTALYC